AMLARLDAIAVGSGLPFRSLCLMNAMEALLGSVRGRTVPIPLGGCSALAVKGRMTADGTPVVAHNFDYVPVVAPFYMLRESRPANGFRSLDFLVAPMPGTVDGINEKGLCITFNYAFVTDHGGPAPLISMAIADALATCSTVSEALAMISSRNRWGAGIL